MTSHRAEEKFMRLPILAAIMIVIVVAAMTFVIWWRVTNPDPSPNHPIVATKTIYRDAITPEPPQVSPVPTVTSETLIHLARKVKPISVLEKGDRVLYDGNDTRPVCEFVDWAPSAISRGSIVNAVIQCPNEGPFEIQTGYLTSIEVLVPG